ncbi:hypothetical protein HO133_004006 [Letharia lupina]|uniref:HhH-GPD domain-containing protein n=1 Tax=Letharia lupina TaxID=560253 RepID=A0A8H6C9U4_9LECA|nr:uncharacterized protein HO133_004006 [Letharia lupina]KAF6219537.1 hypothetical protein HO133_004006 [Letharia lupina]
MSTRVTRRSAGREPSLLASDKENHEHQLSSPPATPAPSKVNAQASTGSKATVKKTTPEVKVEANEATGMPVSATNSQPPKREAAKKEQTLETKSEHEGPALPASISRKRKRAAAAPKVEDHPDELPHNMGKRPSAKSHQLKDEAAQENAASAKTGTPIKSAVKKSKPEDAISMVEAASTIDASEESPKKKAKKVDHFPCSDPYPDWAHPTPEECQVVHDLLMNAFPKDQHSRFIQPDTVPPPSEFVAGCGEVPTILDAMLRTLLSAATSKRNSSSAFQGLVKRFGLQESGPCNGSVDWTAIRHATIDDVFQAIKTGGLAKNKSKNMKAILDMVYSENEGRCEAHTKVIENDDPSAAPEGADPMNLAQMKGEIDLFERHILTLDYYHLLSKDDALMAMQKYPGIGVKTAACVALFCMQKPCFAVDTHVFRLCRYLGWVPPKDEEVGPGERKRPEVNEVNTFKHCEVRIPENLKYGLHQLFWDHGNHCGRCRAITGETSEGWADANCPIEHLVKRYGEKKGGLASPVKKGGKATKGKGRNKLDSDDDDEDMEDVGNEEMELGKDEDDYSPTKGQKKTKADPATNSAKLVKVKATEAIKAGKAGEAKAGKVVKPAGVTKAAKASKGNSGKKGAKRRKAVESDEDRKTATDAEVDDGS